MKINKMYAGYLSTLLEVVQVHNHKRLTVYRIVIGKDFEQYLLNNYDAEELNIYDKQPMLFGIDVKIDPKIHGAYVEELYKFKDY